MSSMLQNLIALLGLLIVAGLGYYLYTQSGGSLTNTSVSGTNEAALEAAEFLARLNELQTLNLDDGLFNDPRFRSLTDVRAEVIAIPVGRNNPFEVSN